MAFSEGFANEPNKEKRSWKFAHLRETMHQSMKLEESRRLKENPKPTEGELCMGAFKEWLEPQVREAVIELYRKGYATQSSGFHGTDCAVQMIDGYFDVDERGKELLQEMGVEVLRGADIGVPRNKLVTALRFRAERPSLDEIKAKWDAVAAALPEINLPAGVRAICDRAELFRREFAPQRPSLDEAHEQYLRYIRRNTIG